MGPPSETVSEVGRWLVTELKHSEPGLGSLSVPSWPGDRLASPPDQASVSSVEAAASGHREGDRDGLEWTAGLWFATHTGHCDPCPWDPWNPSTFPSSWGPGVHVAFWHLRRMAERPADRWQGPRALGLWAGGGQAAGRGWPGGQLHVGLESETGKAPLALSPQVQGGQTAAALQPSRWARMGACHDWGVCLTPGK